MKLALHKPSQLIPHEINLPGSKSISNRILIIKALSGLDFSIQNLSDSDDTRHLLKALESFSNTTTTTTIDVGHAGTDMRFLTAFLSLQNGSYELTGSLRSQQRPIKELVDVLRTLGADISYKVKEGYAPLLIKGKHLDGGKVEIIGGVSSQFITALLLVAPYFTNGLELTIIDELVSKPYVGMTIELMKQFGAKVNWSGNKITVDPVQYIYHKKEFVVESDWSAASYYYSLVALSANDAKLTLRGLFDISCQADAVCGNIYQWFGVNTEFLDDKIIIRKAGTHNRKDVLDFNLVECPDIAQTIICTCIGLNVSFKFSGLQTLKVKETDRILALQNELKKFGCLVEVTENSVQWTNTNKTAINDHLSIATYQDHRMAMSFAPLCLIVDGLMIENAGVVSKSYPLFWEHLKLIGIDQTQI